MPVMGAQDEIFVETFPGPTKESAIRNRTIAHRDLLRAMDGSGREIAAIGDGNKGRKDEVERF